MNGSERLELQVRVVSVFERGERAENDNVDQLLAPGERVAGVRDGAQQIPIWRVRMRGSHCGAADERWWRAGRGSEVVAGTNQHPS